MITGQKVTRPTKSELPAQVANLIGVGTPYVSGGGSVDSAFLDQIHHFLAGGPTGAADTYRKTEVLLDRLGLTYDPYWDTSESAGAGGGTVTTRAFSRVLTAISGVPRCFILNVNDSSVGTRWEVNHDEVYRYDGTVSGRMSLNDAGPDSRVIYYATSSSKTHPKHFIATATVAYIGPGWTGPWEARLEDYSPFASPVPGSEVQMDGWNKQVAITEITFDTYQAILDAGGVAADVAVSIPTTQGKEEPDSDMSDPGGGDVAVRVVDDFPVEGLEVSVSVPTILPRGNIAIGSVYFPVYLENDDSLTASDPGALPPKSRNSKRDKLAEKRAVDIVIKAMAKDGWVMTRDRQKDGMGYDLDFEKAARRLKVEVKGIQGVRLTFNITPKELWRAQTDPEWVLIAVTSVLSPTDPKVQFVTRDRIVEARRVVTGYRLSV